MTIEQYHAQVKQALGDARTTCKRYTMGKDCGLRFYRARKDCFLLHCVECGHSEAHGVGDDEQLKEQHNHNH